MDIETARTQIKALGLIINEDKILDKSLYFGEFMDDEIVTPQKDRIVISKIQSIGYTKKHKLVTILMTDDTFANIIGEDLKTINGFSIRPAPSTIFELNNAFGEIYPDCGTQLYYDELLERDIVDMAMFGRPNEGVVPINDSILAIYYEDLEKKLMSHGFIGKPPSFIVRDEVLKIRIHNNKRNMFREWVESHEWDGTPRVRTWFQRLFGATAPPLEDTKQDQKYLGDVAEAWFVGGIKRMYSETKHEIVPVLIGDQGIGKGLGLKFTAGSDHWYTDTSVNIKEPDKFLDGVRGNIIVELSESTQIRNAESEALKAFISKSSDQLRKAYARYNEKYPRHFILIASSNLDNIFTDLTGNRRYFPMYCDPHKASLKFSQDRTVGQYEVEQLWAEALDMYRKGSKWYMSEESARIAKVVQEYGTVENPSLSMVDGWLDDPANGYADLTQMDGRPTMISREIILRDVFGVPKSMLVPKEVETAYRAWTNGTKNWVRMSKSARIGGKVQRAYQRVLEPGQTKNISRICIVDGCDSNSLTEGDPVTVMRNRAEKYGFREVGDDFPIDGLSKEMIETLELQGYIFSTGAGQSEKYYLGVLP